MIFTGREQYEMAMAAVGMAALRGAPLIELVGKVTTLDDIYYMELGPETYQAALRAEGFVYDDPEEPWESQFTHGGWAHDGFDCYQCYLEREGRRFGCC